MYKINTIIFLTIILYLATSNLYSLTLDEAIKKSLLKYPGYKMRKYDVKLGELNLKLSYSKFYPYISTEITGSDRYDDLDGKTAQTTLNLNYNIFNGLKDILDVKINKLNLRLSKFIYKDYKNFILKEVSNIYYNALEIKNIINSYKNIVNTSKIALNVAKSQYKIGRIREVEYLQAEVNYSRSQYEYNNYIQQLKNILINLSTFTGENYSIDTPLETDFSNIELSNIGYYISKGHKNNLEVVTKRIESQISSKEIKKSYSDFSPTVDIYATKGRYYDENLRDEHYTGSQVGITTTFDLFTGFSRYYNVISEKTQYYNDLMDEKLASLEMKEQIKTLYNNIVTYNDQFYYLSNLIKYSKRNYMLTLESFILGKSDILELLDVRDRYEEAFIDYYTARYNIVRDYNELLYISGTISD